MFSPLMTFEVRRVREPSLVLLSPVKNSGGLHKRAAMMKYAMKAAQTRSEQLFGGRIN
jgi:hypothetical protein